MDTCTATVRVQSHEHSDVKLHVHVSPLLNLGNAIVDFILELSFIIAHGHPRADLVKYLLSTSQRADQNATSDPLL